MTNQEIVNIFYQLAGLLEIKGENPFKIQAIRKAARIIESFTEDIEELYKTEELLKYQGIGKGIYQKIGELLNTGKLQEYEKLKREIPEGLLNILSIPQIGPKTVQLLYHELGITTIDELEKAAKENKIADLFRMGEKTQENILKGIELFRRKKGRYLLGVVYPLSENIIKKLKQLDEVKQISCAGSLRRYKETIGDIDILITSDQPEKVMDFFVTCDFVKEVLAKGKTKSSILTPIDIQVDLRVVEEESYGAALQYFTGSKEHNIALRELSIKKGLKINEYGVFDKQGKKVAGRDEKSIYKILGLLWIPPELRENTGEIESALKNELPKLVSLEDIKGDLQIHSNWSDGSGTINSLLSCARQKKYKYIAITDHSQSLKVAGGLTPERLKEQIEFIREINKKQKDIYVLSGIEVDIKKDGTLDLEDEILQELDIVIAAIHSNFKMEKYAMTNRLIKAMRNKNVDVISHPTGRLIGEREPYELDLEKIFSVAAEEKVALEINAFPERLDLRDIYCKKAKEIGVKFSIGTDAHSINQLDYIIYGITTSRRGWLEKEDILNTKSCEELIDWLKHR